MSTTSITIDRPDGTQLVYTVDGPRFVMIRKFLKFCKQEYLGGTHQGIDFDLNPPLMNRVNLEHGKIFFIPDKALTTLQTYITATKDDVWNDSISTWGQAETDLVADFTQSDTTRLHPTDSVHLVLSRIKGEI